MTGRVIFRKLQSVTQENQRLKEEKAILWEYLQTLARTTPHKWLKEEVEEMRKKLTST